MANLINFITGIGFIAVLAVIYAESGLFIGFFLPGDSLLFTAGFLIQQGFFPIGIHVAVPLLFVAAVLGESTGYLFGRKVGRKLFERRNSRFFRRENLLRAEQFYEKYGSITIVLACFIPFVRTFVPIVAGISKMEYRRFIPFNILGALTWTASFTYIGYYAGAFLESRGINVEITAIIIILLSISPMIIHILRDADRRRGLWQATKREVAIILGRQKRI